MSNARSRTAHSAPFHRLPRQYSNDEDGDLFQRPPIPLRLVFLFQLPVVLAFNFFPLHRCYP